MYALMDAEYTFVAVPYSILLVLVIAFLGIELFTSALCASSLQVR